MPKLLQINVTANWGSTGKIAEQIGLCAIKQGWDSYIAYGRYMNMSKSHLIKIGSMVDVYEHYMEHILFDNEGLASRLATKRFIKQIDELKPDIVHLHNIHDHYLNYCILFKYLNDTNIPVVWTLHDCWAFTGGCAHYTINNCYQWQSECVDCMYKRALVHDSTHFQFNCRKNIFLKNKHLTLVPVSKWLEKELKKSFFRYSRIHTILNAVDVEQFKPTPSSDIRVKYNIGKGEYLLALAASWSDRKGLTDYFKLSTYIKCDLKIVLVGLSMKQQKDLPKNIIAIPRTQDINELVQLYSEASVILNLSYEETFGLTTVEGLACGTPGIVYDCTASPELITPETGIVVPAGDVIGVNHAINEILNKDKIKLSNACRNRAINNYNTFSCFNKYIELYNSILNEKSI